jgi:hypothetical protein
MFKLIRNLLSAADVKPSRPGRIIALEAGGRPRWTPRDYAALARAGYARNAIVHRAVRLIAESIGGLSFVLYEGGREHTTHPLTDLIARPNPRQDGAALLESVASHLLLAGNAYVEAVALAGQENAHGGAQNTAQVRELYALRPDRMKVVPGPDGWPQGYDYTVGGATVRAPLTARDREICARLAPRLRADGLWFVGLDVIGDWLTEVNVTSPTGIQEINALDGVALERDGPVLARIARILGVELDGGGRHQLGALVLGEEVGEIDVGVV